MTSSSLGITKAREPLGEELLPLHVQLDGMPGPVAIDGVAVEPALNGRFTAGPGDRGVPGPVGLEGSTLIPIRSDSWRIRTTSTYRSMSVRPMGAVDAVKPNVPRARASAMSLAATVLESTTATSVSTVCADAAAPPAAAREPRGQRDDDEAPGVRAAPRGRWLEKAWPIVR